MERERSYQLLSNFGTGTELAKKICRKNETELASFQMERRRLLAFNMLYSLLFCLTFKTNGECDFINYSLLYSSNPPSLIVTFLVFDFFSRSSASFLKRSSSLSYSKAFLRCSNLAFKNKTAFKKAFNYGRHKSYLKDS